MKFKSVFIICNILLFSLLGILCLIPFLAGGFDFALAFWRVSWPLVLFLILFLAGLELFYFCNYRLFHLVEREDWPALVQYLENRVVQQGHYRPYLVRLLANTYLVLSDSAAVISLESKTALVKPALIEANALIFGTARILGKDIRGAVDFFWGRLAAGAFRREQAQWLRWYYGFSLLLDRQFAPASDQFLLLVKGADDALVAGLSAFFLQDVLKRVLPERALEFKAAAQEGQNRVRKFLPARENWNREAAKIETEIYAAVQEKNLGNAAQWIYGSST